MSSISYNGVPFSDRSHHIEISTELVYDEAGRVPIEKRHQIRIRSTVVPDGVLSGEGTCPPTNELTLDTMRERLMQGGKALIIEDTGFGPLDVNSSNTDSVNDIASGPKPTVLRWLPIADNKAAEVTWSCVVTVPCCDNDSGLKSLNYGVSFNINFKGFTTKTVRGHILVTQSVGTGSASHSADDFRDRINVVKSINSHREQSYDLSPDKSRLDFTIVDREIESPNAYPAGVVFISAPYKIRIPYPDPAAIVVQNTQSVQIELEATTPRVRAWEIFVAIFGERIVKHEADADSAVIVTGLTVSEDIFTHKYDFSLSYKVTTSFERLLLDSNLFSAYPVNWQDWSDSVTLAQGSRGLGQFKHSRAVQSDPLVQLCDTSNPTTTEVALEATDYFRTIDTYAILSNDIPPPPALSWVKYDAYLIEATDYNRTFHTTYGDAPRSTGDFDPSLDLDGGPTTTVDSTNYEQYLSDSPPVQMWIWKGQAHRVGYPIPKIGKTMIGEQPVEIIGEPRIMRRLLGYLFRQPVYEVAWSIGLIATTTPTPTDQDNDPTPTNNDFIILPLLDDEPTGDE